MTVVSFLNSEEEVKNVIRQFSDRTFFKDSIQQNDGEMSSIVEVWSGLQKLKSKLLRSISNIIQEILSEFCDAMIALGAPKLVLEILIVEVKKKKEEEETNDSISNDWYVNQLARVRLL